MDTRFACGAAMQATSADIWTNLELVDINYDNHHDVVLTTLTEVRHGSGINH